MSLFSVGHQCACTQQLVKMCFFNAIIHFFSMCKKLFYFTLMPEKQKCVCRHTQHTYIFRLFKCLFSISIFITFSANCLGIKKCNLWLLFSFLSACLLHIFVDTLSAGILLLWVRCCVQKWERRITLKKIKQRAGRVNNLSAKRGHKECRSIALFLLLSSALKYKVFTMFRFIYL